MAQPKYMIGVTVPFTLSPSSLKRSTTGSRMSTRRMVVVRTEGGAGINRDIRKTEDKVVDTVVVGDTAVDFRSCNMEVET